ncbi:MAG: THUMP domain-containing protein [Infirmifilum sp.]
MLEDFNLVVATYRLRENDCISELWFFAREIGDKALDASKTGLPSLIVVKTGLDPEEFTSRMREKILENPYYFRYVLKVTPIQITVDASLENIRDAALRLASARLEPSETYKVEAHVRLSELRREDIIDAIATHVQNKVSLETPDKIITVEVIGERAGLSVIKPSSIISVEKLRREARKLKQKPVSAGEVEEGSPPPENTY